ncbi:MAG: hypothetical protein SFW35_06750 [Chitinophagales bacterium]|nr:hypothetical protein [Chitinophagales bacterium]
MGNWKQVCKQILAFIIAVQLFNVGIYQQCWVQYSHDHPGPKDPIEDVLEMVMEECFHRQDFDHTDYSNNTDRGYQLIEIIDIVDLFPPQLDSGLKPLVLENGRVIHFPSYCFDHNSHIEAVSPPPPEQNCVA